LNLLDSRWSLPRTLIRGENDKIGEIMTFWETINNGILEEWNNVLRKNTHHSSIPIRE
jgi:hypothetical protein